MLFLGFSAGLPFLLVFSTLSAWLRDYGVSKSAIGFFAWVGLTYSIKVFWAPFVDSIKLPLLFSRLGRRRSWLLAAQLGVAIGLVLMVQLDPRTQLAAIALCAVWVAFSSATQDIALDAFRIESADESVQGAMAASYLLGYRLALMASGAGALYLADIASWQVAYWSMAALMLLAMLATLFASEPALKNTPLRASSALSLAGLKHSFVDPFIDFFQRNGRFALLVLAFVGLYRLSDLIMGIMANPFYLDLGFTKTQIAQVTKVFGIVVTIVGAFVGGIVVARYGVYGPLLIGACSAALANLFFAKLALVGADVSWLYVTISADNFSAGFAQTVFIAYLSGLTNRAYTATQYALFSSLMTLPGKFASGFSGVFVDSFSYQVFFLYAAAMGLPAILLSLILWRRASKLPAS
nr:MFS transporter [Agaribacterium haliotis]